MEMKPYPAEENIEMLYDIDLSPLLNFLFGHHARFNVDKMVIESLKKLNLKLKKKQGFTLFTLYFTAMLDEDVLDSVNNMGYYHDSFGEGFKDDRKKTGNTYKSYLFSIPQNRFIHIGFDHRGTSINLPINTTEQEFESVVDWVINVCYNYNKKTFMDYYTMCNK